MSEGAPKVVSIRGGVIATPGEPKPDVIEVCQELLERALSGELAGVTAVLHHADDSRSHQHAGPVEYATIGALETLKALLCADIAERV